METNLTADSLRFIIARLIANADESIRESRENRGDLFKSGRSEAYYEMLDTLKSELGVRGEDLAQYGLNVNLEQRYI
ncbi:MAG: transposase [Oscillibacter sp.]|nr:transposase [Oscillibacter sp.]